MSKFKYMAVDDRGQYIKGLIEAQNFDLAMENLKSRGYWILELVDPSKSLLKKDISFGGPRIKIDQFTVFCRQLATMYRAGVNLVEALQIMSRQTGSKVFRKVLEEIIEDMKGGMQFSAAAASHPTIFTAVFVNVVRAGEVSGNLDEMLHRLAVFYEKEYYTKQKVSSAMVYPAIMGIVMVMVITFMMIFVIPRYVQNFEAMGMELPKPTQIVIAVSDAIQQYWYLIPIVIIVPMLIVKALQHNARSRYWIDYWKLRMPVFGQLWHKQAIARFSRTFTSLYGAAIPMLHTLTITSKVVSNDAIAKLILDSRESIRGGHSIADPFRKSWLFPPMVVHMLAIGEKSGSLDTMIEKVADFYEADVDAMADRLKAMLEPIMLLVIAVAVGAIVVAIMLPVFKLMENMPGM